MIKWMNPVGALYKFFIAVQLATVVLFNATGLYLFGTGPEVIRFQLVNSIWMVTLMVLYWKRVAEIVKSAQTHIDVPCHKFIPRLEEEMVRAHVGAKKGQPPGRPFYAIRWDEVYHVGDLVMRLRAVSARTVVHIGPVKRDDMHDLLTLQVLVERAAG